MKLRIPFLLRKVLGGFNLYALHGSDYPMVATIRKGAMFPPLRVPIHTKGGW